MLLVHALEIATSNELHTYNCSLNGCDNLGSEVSPEIMMVVMMIMTVVFPALYREIYF